MKNDAALRGQQFEKNLPDVCAFRRFLLLEAGAEILILDEPTSGLDPFSRDELLALFVELKSRGVAVLFSTHITSDLEKCADDIIYIRKGKVIADCAKEEFRKAHCRDGETPEEAILRMEREGAVC